MTSLPTSSRRLPANWHVQDPAGRQSRDRESSAFCSGWPPVCARLGLSSWGLEGNRRAGMFKPSRLEIVAPDAHAVSSWTAPAGTSPTSLRSRRT
jgi:hypothetical protein